jgi:hypothetical protein
MDFSLTFRVTADLIYVNLIECLKKIVYCQMYIYVGLLIYVCLNLNEGKSNY